MKRKEKYGHQNHKKIYLIVYILLLVVTSCKTNNELINFNDVESIKVWYISKEVCTMVPFRDCGAILRMEDSRDTVISDKDIIKRYVSIVNRLKPINPEAYYDLRVSSWIRMKKIGEEKRQSIGVCIDLSGKVLRNDTLMQGNKKEIKKFLDEILYDPLSPEAWTPDFMKVKNIE
ncbi:hypothetical protein SAMN05444349_1442 [Bacteroides faecichinchillae]|uniref:Lipoprotein n=1 Tax=Bacteroides faecichinchillae TaxID=871325 RepID=A0A1M5FDI1_9BACE|nr:hypothetical protein [Bacteroides faecichinchillae]THG60586.1 hypothetical protein E5981_15020 [Bacteroides faecichinchillae]SHF89610.1 hypothetical protein SAMN05444349_1442 [Bacteroides faecichinchillae]